MVQTFSLYALVGVDEHIDPAQSTLKGRFVLRADSIRPYVWRAVTNRRIGTRPAASLSVGTATPIQIH